MGRGTEEKNHWITPDEGGEGGSMNTEITRKHPHHKHRSLVCQFFLATIKRQMGLFQSYLSNQQKQFFGYTAAGNTAHDLHVLVSMWGIVFVQRVASARDRITHS